MDTSETEDVLQPARPRLASAREPRPVTDPGYRDAAPPAKPTIKERLCLWVAKQAAEAAAKEYAMKMPKNWKTSLGGLGAIMAAAGGALKALTDGDPSTMPDWTTLLATISAGLALLKAKDHNVTGGTVHQ